MQVFEWVFRKGFVVSYSIVGHEMTSRLSVHGRYQSFELVAARSIMQSDCSVNLKAGMQTIQGFLFIFISIHIFIFYLFFTQ